LPAKPPPPARPVKFAEAEEMMRLELAEKSIFPPDGGY
jgi:hypothetical protein